MNILRNSDIPSGKWDDLLLQSFYSSPFQSREFYKLCNSVNGISAEALAVEESGNLLSLCVVTLHHETGFKSLLSRRAIVYGGPVVRGNDFEVVKLLLKTVYSELHRKFIYIEIRNFFDYSELRGFYEDAGWKWFSYLDIKLEFKNHFFDDILKSMKYNRKREIKLSLKEGTVYREAKDQSEVEVLYSMLRDLYKNKVKLPIPNLDFFLALFTSTIGKVFVVTHNDKIVGGSFCFYLRGKSIYTMYYCGMRNYHSYIFPTHLSIVAAIDFGIRNNLDYLDFMGAGLKDKEYGVRKYKQEFGGEIYEYGRLRKVSNKFLYFIGKTGVKLLKFK